MVNMRRSAIVSSLLLFGGASSTDPYSAKNFIRRTGHSLNDTLVIPLDQSWSNATVPIKVIPKNAPVFDEAALWVDEAQNAMYMWGGQGPWGNISKEKTLWGFDAGSQQWAKKTPSNVDVFMNLARTSLAARTTCRGLGFYLGGFVSSWTDPAAKTGDSNFPAPGLLTYDLARGGWANRSTAALNAYGTLVGGALACLPRFGTDARGLVLALGGEVARPGDYSPAKADALVSLSNLTFWDLATETWHAQPATGDVPAPRSRACVVAAAGATAGSYELFLYGGYDAAANKTFTDVYVLSVPGFVWFKTGVDVGGAPRLGQACALAGGSSSRQMIVVGGANEDLPYFNKFRDPDPWANGINVLDLTDLAWKSQYDAAAPAYEPPAVVKDWYNAGNQDKVAWQSETVMKLFQGGGNSTTANAPDNSRSASAHTGAIVGGAVGGTVAVALLALAFLLVRRRRSKNQWAAAQQQKPTAAAPSESHLPSPAAATDSGYKYQPYAPSSAAPGLYEAPGDASPPLELPAQYGQPAATPPQGFPVVHPHGHSSQQPGRQSHFYEMP
ncbi:hypothetical protein PG999_012330 [Apiospora kogelbergensis]|uniref:Kelch motif-containing protein n=1 Tax=Apiospora kogelbergensis TaxID=1337665 RepID=A0AAW0QHW3_9PEZI